ncbi:zinc finger protein 320 isoform X1 [Bombyx mori]|uniref:Uncharacterized protein n=2 Tax=Bombyx mori TaxID=7091 RepID=A0A8R2DKJ2_BOMMO|nr:zinc finger protein 320 isoform X1 [Bombyx mori]
MDSEIMVEMLPLLGVCSLCLNDGAVKSMLTGHKHNDTMEIYSDMLLKCFSIDITAVELGDTKRLICMTCISRLRDCVAFRVQVEASLYTLEDTFKLENVESHGALDDLKTEALGDVVANEIADYANDTPDADEDDDDETALKYLIKKECHEDFSANTRRRRKKYIKISLKQTEDLADTDLMLQSGLFPFKIKTNRTFSCAVCPEKSSSLDEIKEHVTQHDRSNIHVAFKKMIFSKSQRFYKSGARMCCKTCSAHVSDYEELSRHVQTCSMSKYNRSCNNLPFKLEKDQLDCPICKKNFLNYVSLNTHMNEHYPDFICENCGKAFASKARLRGHMRTHEVGTFPCKYCSATFDRITKRENHVSKEHKAGVRYACKRCNISLTSFYARQKHLAEVHNEELKRYKCKSCPQSYITPGHLSSHVRRDHLNERNHKCEKCDQAFYTRNALKMHMIKHDGERIHACPVCSKSYQRKKTLREHMRIHNNDKRFTCPVCGRAFTQKCTLKGHLKVHERKVDIDERIMQPLHSI